MNQFKGQTSAALVTVLLVLSGCRQNNTNAALTGRDVEAVRSVQERYATGWKAEDPELAILSLFTDDAVLLPHHGDPQVKGKAALREHFWPAGLAGFQVNSYDFDIMEINGSGELAYSRGRYGISFSYEGDGGERHTVSNAGNYVMIFRRTGDGWKISRYIWNDPVPGD